MALGESSLRGVTTGGDNVATAKSGASGSSNRSSSATTRRADAREIRRSHPGNVSPYSRRNQTGGRAEEGYLGGLGGDSGKSLSNAMEDAIGVHDNYHGSGHSYFSRITAFNVGAGLAAAENYARLVPDGLG